MKREGTTGEDGPTTQSTIDPARRAAALTRAVLGAASRLGVSGGLLAKILRTTDVSVARMQAGAEVLPTGSKSSVRGELFVQLFHNLDATMDHVDEASRAWLNTNCLELEGRPINVIQTGEGLMKAVGYLSSKKRRPSAVER